MLLVDTACRYVGRWSCPLGVLTALIGTPVFMWLLALTFRRRHERRRAVQAAHSALGGFGGTPMSGAGASRSLIPPTRGRSARRAKGAE